MLRAVLLCREEMSDHGWAAVQSSWRVLFRSIPKELGGEFIGGAVRPVGSLHSSNGPNSEGRAPPIGGEMPQCGHFPLLLQKESYVLGGGVRELLRRGVSFLGSEMPRPLALMRFFAAENVVTL